MTSKLVVNTIEADTGISSVSFASSISMNSTAKFHFSAAGVDIGADTNINRPAAGVLGFNINGSQKVVITSNGRLGIGTNNPTQLIEVQDRSTGTLCGLNVGTQYGNAHFGGYNNYPAIMNSGNQPLIYCDTNNDRTIFFGDTVGFGTTCAFRVNGAERLRITSAGQMVMGATTSKAKFEIKDNGYTSTSVLQRISADDHNPYALIIANDTVNTNSNSGLQFFVNDQGIHYIRARGSSTASNNDLLIASQNNIYFNSGSTESERVRITSTGQLIMGTPVNTGYNESAALISIAADTSAAANMLSDSSAIYNHTNPAFIHVQNRYNTGTGQEAGIIFHSRSSHNGSWAIYGKRTSSSYLSDLIFRNRTGGSSSAERLRIHSTGQVTKPASCAFNVTPNGNQSLGNGETLTSWKTTDSRGFENTTTGGYFGSGIFTAPVTGAYYFTSNILLYDTNGTNSIHLYWQKNGSGTHTYWNTRFNAGDFGYGNYMPVAGACTMYMSAGDTCRIKISFTGSNCGMYGNDQNWGNWGGFLIG